MQLWEALRDSTYDPGFEPALAACGLSLAEWDRVAPDVDEALCGFTTAKLNEIYPVLLGKHRMVLTAAAFGVPALRVAFYAESDSDNAKIVYVAGSRR